MNTTSITVPKPEQAPTLYTEGEKAERRALGLPACEPAPTGLIKRMPKGRTPAKKSAIKAPKVLNEACDYGSAFTRGLRVELPGETLYPGDFRAQLWRTYHNLSALLESEGANWEDVVRTTCYIRDIERDYAEFNSIRNEFFRALGLDPFPASTGIQARICRSDLLVEIEALAIMVR
jgi:2-iminobutanoate/2-iminopropanoate deaminase